MTICSKKTSLIFTSISRKKSQCFCYLIDGEIMAKKRRNPSITCGNCRTGNREDRETCWKCGFDLGATSAQRTANIRHRAAVRMGATTLRHNPKKLRKHAKTPLAVRKAQQTLRNRGASKNTKTRAKATIRRYNAANARKSSRPKISVVSPGILGGKGATQRGANYFINKARRNYAATIRGLTNLERWNKNKKPSLSKWASRMKDRIRLALGRPKRKVKGKRRRIAA